MTTTKRPPEAFRSARLPEWMVGKTSEKLDATSVIWDFFKEHPRRQEAFRPEPPSERW